MISYNTFTISPLPQKKTSDDLDKLVKETVAEWKQRTAAWQLKQTGSRQLRRESLKTNISSS
jgi:hypothetical protein